MREVGDRVICTYAGSNFGRHGIVRSKFEPQQNIREGVCDEPNVWNVLWDATDKQEQMLEEINGSWLADEPSNGNITVGIRTLPRSSPLF